MLRADVEELAVFVTRTDQGVFLCERQGQLWRTIETLKGLLEQSLDDGTYLPVSIEVVTQGVIAGLLDEPGGILLRQRDDAPHAAMTDATFGVEQVLAQRLRLWTDVGGAGQRETGLARWIERALALGQFEGTGLSVAWMGAQQFLRAAITDLDRGVVDAYAHETPDGRGPRRRRSSSPSSISQAIAQSSPAAPASPTYFVTTPLEMPSDAAIRSWEKPPSNLSRKTSLIMRMFIRCAGTRSLWQKLASIARVVDVMRNASPAVRFVQSRSRNGRSPSSEIRTRRYRECDRSAFWADPSPGRK